VSGSKLKPVLSEESSVSCHCKMPAELKLESSVENQNDIGKLDKRGTRIKRLLELEPALEAAAETRGSMSKSIKFTTITIV